MLYMHEGKYIGTGFDWMSKNFEVWRGKEMNEGLTIFMKLVSLVNNNPWQIMY